MKLFINEIIVNERIRKNPTHIKGLIDDIKENGQIQPITVRIDDNGSYSGISWRKAKRVYDECDRIEREELASFRIEPRKVRITTVCRVAHVSISDIKRIKKADGVRDQSAKTVR